MAMRARAALLLLLAASLARADDPAPADPIASAKKDFATIKSLSSPSDTGQVLPSMDLKDLGPSPSTRTHISAPPPLADPDAALDPAKKKEKEGTGNWLVDAMDKKSDRQASSKGRDDPLKADEDFLRDGDAAGSQGDRDSQAASEAREKAGDKELAGAVVNPLDSFMAGWISARDHDLLIPARSDAGQAGDAPRPHPDSLAEIDLGVAASSDSPLPSPEGAGWADSRPASNPFVAALELDPVPAIRFFSAPEASGFGPAGPVAAPSAPGIDPRPLDSGRTFVPDFAQPTDDDKYFKQLKKF